MKKTLIFMVILIFVLALMVYVTYLFHPFKIKLPKKYVKLETGVIAPSNLLKCPLEFYEKLPEGNMKIPFNKYPNEDICLYFQLIKNGTVETNNQQYNNVVTACRFFEANGEKVVDKGTSYILIGYEKKTCTQGIYKQ